MDIRTLSGSLYSARNWMKLVGVMMIINGVFTALSIIGILIAWLPIWLGILLFQAAGAIEQAYNSGDENAFLMSQAKLKTYFTIMGVLMLIAIVIIVAMIFLGGMAAFMGMANM